MTLLPLAVVSERDALALAGPDSWVLPIRDLAYAQGTEGCVIVADPVDDPGRSGVWNAHTFRVLGPVPNTVRTVWVRRSDMRPPVHVFVRLDAGCLYLGTASPCAYSHSPYAPAGDFELAECLLRLHRPVPAEVLDRVRPPAVPADVPGVAWVERIAEDRVAALRAFLTGWYPDLVPEQRPFGRDLAALPLALAEFHRLTYRMRIDQAVPEETTSTSELMLTRHQRKLTGDYGAVLSREPLDVPADHHGPVAAAQGWLADPRRRLGDGVVFWAYPAASSIADPVVSLLGARPEPLEEREPLSGFLVQLALFEAVMTKSPYRAVAFQAPTSAVSRITGSLTPVPLQPLRWPHDPTSFYVGPGLVGMVTAGGGGYPKTDNTVSLYVGCRHRSLLRPVADAGVQWDVLDY